MQVVQVAYVQAANVSDISLYSGVSFEKVEHTLKFAAAKVVYTTCLQNTSSFLLAFEAICILTCEELAELLTSLLAPFQTAWCLSGLSVVALP